MKLNIAQTIKQHRKERGITQEEFAEILGVTCQSVSRWENDVCYPDMELIPTIARFFGISTDKLMGVDDSKEKEKVNGYLEGFQEAISQGRIDDCIRIARDGVKEFPNNYILLNKLMYALFVSGDEDGNIPNREENAEKYDEEITALGERIMKYCPDVNLKLEAAARTAFNHCLQGRKEQGRRIYESFPAMELCKENQMWWALENQEKLPFLQKAIRQSYESLTNFIWLLANAGVADIETQMVALEKLLDLEQLIFDDNRPKNNWGSVRLAFELAKRYALLGDYDNTFVHLWLAVTEAKAFDKFPLQQKYSAVLVGEITEKRTDFETADTRPLCEILRDQWLVQREFDCVRDTDKFKGMIKELS